MKKQELQTPAILLDMDILERNIRTYQEACNQIGRASCRERVYAPV